jgi:hypothetical protein
MLIDWVRVEEPDYFFRVFSQALFIFSFNCRAKMKIAARKNNEGQAVAVPRFCVSFKSSL